MIALRRSGRNEHGFFTIWVLGLVVIVFFLGGLSFDLWHAIDQRRQLASMVDGAAVAGATQVDIEYFKTHGSGDDTAGPEEKKNRPVNLDENAARAKATEYLQKVSQETNTPITNPDIHLSQPYRVSVTASTTLKLTLTRILFRGDDVLTVTVHGYSDARSA